MNALPLRLAGGMLLSSLPLEGGGAGERVGAGPARLR